MDPGHDALKNDLQAKLMRCLDRGLASESKRHFVAALDDYRHAVELLVELMQVEKNPDVLLMLRRKAQSVMQRAEEVKSKLRTASAMPLHAGGGGGALHHVPSMPELRGLSLSSQGDGEEAKEAPARSDSSPQLPQQQSFHYVRENDDGEQIVATSFSYTDEDEKFDEAILDGYEEMAVDQVRLLVYSPEHEEGEDQGEGTMQLIVVELEEAVIRRMGLDRSQLNAGSSGKPALAFLRHNDMQMPISPEVLCVRTAPDHFMFPTDHEGVFYAFVFPKEVGIEHLDAFEEKLTERCFVKRSEEYQRALQFQQYTLDPISMVGDDDEYEFLEDDEEFKILGMTKEELMETSQVYRELLEQSEIGKEVVKQGKEMYAHAQKLYNSTRGLVECARERRLPTKEELEVVTEVLQGVMKEALSQLPAREDMLECVEAASTVASTVRNGQLPSKEDLLHAVAATKALVSAAKNARLPSASALKDAAISSSSLVQSSKGLLEMATRMRYLGSRKFLLHAAKNLTFGGVDLFLGKQLGHLDPVINTATDMVDWGIIRGGDLVCTGMDYGVEMLKRHLKHGEKDKLYVPSIVRYPVKKVADLSPLAVTISGGLVKVLVKMVMGISKIIGGGLRFFRLTGKKGLLTKSGLLKGAGGAGSAALHAVGTLIDSLEIAGTKIIKHAGRSLVDVINYRLGEDAAALTLDSWKIGSNVVLTWYRVKTLGPRGVIKAVTKQTAKKHLKCGKYPMREHNPQDPREVLDGVLEKFLGYIPAQFPTLEGPSSSSTPTRAILPATVQQVQTVFQREAQVTGMSAKPMALPPAAAHAVSVRTTATSPPRGGGQTSHFIDDDGRRAPSPSNASQHAHPALSSSTPTMGIGGEKPSPMTYGGASSSPMTYGGASSSPMTYGGASSSPMTYGGAPSYPHSSTSATKGNYEEAMRRIASGKMGSSLREPSPHPHSTSRTSNPIPSEAYAPPPASGVSSPHARPLGTHSSSTTHIPPASAPRGGQEGTQDPYRSFYSKYAAMSGSSLHPAARQSQGGPGLFGNAPPRS